MAFPEFRKQGGVWEVTNEAGEWEGGDDPVLQSIMQHVESVDYKGPGGEPRFHFTAEYKRAAELAGGTSPSAVSYKGMFDRYQASKQSSQPAVGMDIRADWKKYFPDTGMPDIFLRNQSGQIERYEAPTDKDGNLIPLKDDKGQPVYKMEGTPPVRTRQYQQGDLVMDMEKLKRVLEQINVRKGADPSAAQIISVEGIQDKFVNIGGQLFKTKASATMVGGKPQFHDIEDTDSKVVVYGNTMQIVGKSEEDWEFTGAATKGYVEVSSGRWVEEPGGEAQVITTSSKSAQKREAFCKASCHQSTISRL